MDTRQCENCDEIVDTAKAFCPGCGNAFVEEKAREQASEFESHDNTVQMGQTMYNQMLSDMGLNISKKGQQPTAEPKKEEVVVPVAPAAPPAAPSVELKPAALSPVELKPAAPPPTSAKPDLPAEASKAGSNKWIWIIVAGLILIVLFAALIVAAAVGFYIFTAR